MSLHNFPFFVVHRHLSRNYKKLTSVLLFLFRVLLVLSHGNDQTVTQKKIESYLAESTAVASEGPKALAQRVKLMELYILHVLPRVNDWDYAREFTQMSPYLDADTKDVSQ